MDDIRSNCLELFAILEMLTESEQEAAEETWGAGGGDASASTDGAGGSAEGNKDKGKKGKGKGKKECGRSGRSGLSRDVAASVRE